MWPRAAWADGLRAAVVRQKECDGRVEDLRAAEGGRRRPDAPDPPPGSAGTWKTGAVSAAGRAGPGGAVAVPDHRHQMGHGARLIQKGLRDLLRVTEEEKGAVRIGGG